MPRRTGKARRAAPPSRRTACGSLRFRRRTASIRRFTRAPQSVQEDPCVRIISSIWGFFDDPATTNYACGGWPLQGAMPYGPDDNGLYLDNEIWSPWTPIAGTGSEFIHSFVTYRDLPLDNLQFYKWHIRSRDNNTGGCPGNWQDFGFGYYGGGEDWIRTSFSVGGFIPGTADDLQLALGAIDMCSVWCGIYGSRVLSLACASLRSGEGGSRRVLRSAVHVRDIDMWQDNFPELGGISAPRRTRGATWRRTSFRANKKNFVPGDSLKIVVTDPAGLAARQHGRPHRHEGGLRVREGDRPLRQSDRGKERSRDPVAGHQAFRGDATGFSGTRLWRVLPRSGWDAYRLDLAVTAGGSKVKDTFCGDLMDLAAGPDGPPYHALTRERRGQHGHLRPRRCDPLLHRRQEHGRRLGVLPPDVRRPGRRPEDGRDFARRWRARWSGRCFPTRDASRETSATFSSSTTPTTAADPRSSTSTWRSSYIGLHRQGGPIRCSGTVFGGGQLAGRPREEHPDADHRRPDRDLPEGPLELLGSLERSHGRRRHAERRVEPGEVG